MPKEFLTPEFCLAAVKACEYCIEHVPEELKTLEMCDIVVRNSETFPFIPDKFMTEDYIMETISGYTYALEYLKPELQTEKICIIAVENNYEQLKYVVKQTDDIRKAAFRNNKKAAEYFKFDELLE